MIERITKWHPLLPAAGELLLYSVFMPFHHVPFETLAAHQQLIALSSLPVIFGSIWWFGRANDLNESTTPEERILDNE
jgi:hypothetical protein